MEMKKYLSLGSMVWIKGSAKKLMIVARGVYVDTEEGRTFFDYGACAYPEGMVGDGLVYFQRENVVKVIFHGYEDEENEQVVLLIQECKEHIRQLERQSNTVQYDRILASNDKSVIANEMNQLEPKAEYETLSRSHISWDF